MQLTKLRLTPVLALAVLAGCASGSLQRQGETADGQTNASAREAIMAACKAANDDPILAPLEGKLLPIGSRGPEKFEMLSNLAYATEEERPAIKVYAERLMGCQAQIFEHARQHLTPMHVALLQGSFGADNALLAQLHNSQMTYSEVNQARARLRNENDAAIVRLNARRGR